jgi:sulfatase maturation enzyme AslB (radical SAM superfamily)
MEITLERSTLENVPQFEVDAKPNIVVEKPRVDYKKAIRDFYKTEVVEFTLAVGCPVQCRRYCPQEVFMKKYGNNARMMSFDIFKQILSHMPTSVDVEFSGFCEPFVNPDFVRMAEYAYYNGYKLHVFTTLHGAKTSDVERLLNLEYSQFCLHLRAGQVVDFPLTPEYEHNVFRVIEGLPNVTFCLMNELFTTNNRENVTRGFLPQSKHVGFCTKLVKPQFVVLPNGSVQLCCMDFGLQHTVGNLLNEDYANIKKRFKAKKGFYPLCPYCSFSVPYSRHLYRQMVTKAKRAAYRII